MKQYIITFFLLTLITLPIKAQINFEEIEVSLLTCEQGDEIYTLFGHTAIRINNTQDNTDIVFNYGLFDFNAPNFIWRFTLGETDYQLGATTYIHFLSEYQYYNRSVWEQVLNLTASEKEKLIFLLEENYKPENRIYRYNFLYDNCATKPRDIITTAIEGTITYQGSLNETFRSLIHKHTKDYPWSTFGMDLCLGKSVDNPVSINESMFSPIYLMKHFNNAMITDTNQQQRLLVKKTHTLYHAQHETKKSHLPSPFLSFSFLFLIVLSISILGVNNNKSYWGIDLILLFLFGIPGVIIAFLSFFSTHPGVYPNYLLLLLNPLHLLALPFIIKRIKKRKLSYYLTTYCILLTFFIVLSPLFLQRFNLAMLPLALCILTRGINHIILYRKAK